MFSHIISLLPKQASLVDQWSVLSVCTSLFPFYLVYGSLHSLALLAEPSETETCCRTFLEACSVFSYTVRVSQPLSPQCSELLRSVTLIRMDIPSCFFANITNTVSVLIPLIILYVDRGGSKCSNVPRVKMLCV